MAPDPAATAEAQAVLAAVVDEWMGRRGVVSVEVARRHQPASTDEVAIRVTLERLLPADQVPDGELFPASLDGVPVDLVEGRPPGLE